MHSMYLILDEAGTVWSKSARQSPDICCCWQTETRKRAELLVSSVLSLFKTALGLCELSARSNDVAPSVVDLQVVKPCLHHDQVQWWRCTSHLAASIQPAV